MSDRTNHKELLAWVQSVAALTTPDKIYWVDGSEAEDKRLRELMVQSGSAQWLNPEKRPNCLLVRSDPRDVARVESRTFICSRTKDDAGPTNNWEIPRS
jgi:phosphoenolpyruvate carboxykinase (GTP)